MLPNQSMQNAAIDIRSSETSNTDGKGIMNGVVSRIAAFSSDLAYLEAVTVRYRFHMRQAQRVVNETNKIAGESEGFHPIEVEHVNRSNVLDVGSELKKLRNVMKDRLSNPMTEGVYSIFVAGRNDEFQRGVKREMNRCREHTREIGIAEDVKKHARTLFADMEMMDGA